VSAATETPSQTNGTAPESEAVESHDSLAKALLAIQRDMPAIDRDGQSHHGNYTTLGHLLSKAKPVLTKHGVVATQFPSKDENGSPTLRTILIHAGTGERLEGEAPLSPTKNDPQGLGSALTYMRRYSLAAALSISDQEDDDGKAGSEKPTPAATAAKPKASERAITPAQKGKVNALMGNAELSKAQASAIRVWAAFKAGAAQFDRLPSKAASDLIDELREDGSGAQAILDEIASQAESGNESAQQLVKRMEAENAS
jgi:hypothetical protein